MQARNPRELFCLKRSVTCAVSRKEPRIVCRAKLHMRSENQLRCAFAHARSVPGITCDSPVSTSYGSGRNPSPVPDLRAQSVTLRFSGEALPPCPSCAAGASSDSVFLKTSWNLTRWNGQFKLLICGDQPFQGWRLPILSN